MRKFISGQEKGCTKVVLSQNKQTNKQTNKNDKVTVDKNNNKKINNKQVNNNLINRTNNIKLNV